MGVDTSHQNLAQEHSDIHRPAISVYIARNSSTDVSSRLDDDTYVRKLIIDFYKPVYQLGVESKFTIAQSTSS